MKKTLSLVICLLAFNSYAAGDCTFENKSTIEFSQKLTSALEKLGCVEESEENRAKNHLLVFVLRSRIGDTSSFQMNRFDQMRGRANVVNLLNGKVINIDKWYSTKPKFLITKTPSGPEAYDKKAQKISLKVQADLAKVLKDGFIID